MRMKLGILGCADIAQRRFMPSVTEFSGFECAAIAEEYNKKKLEGFVSYAIPVYDSFDDILNDPAIEAVYIPLPPALHFPYARKALLNGKHVLVEKPSCTCYAQTAELVEIAAEKGLALQENYMFQYHSQLEEIRKLLSEGAIGDIRLIRTDFCFPLREANDFRYNPKLGGGVLLDDTGYLVKMAQLLLGKTVYVETASLQRIDGFEVEMYGCATFRNASGLTMQAGYGMDNHYRCSLDIIGNKGRLQTNRIYTAGTDVTPSIEIENKDGKREIVLPADNHFLHSIEKFYQAITDETLRQSMYDGMLLQAKLMQDIRDKNN